MGIAITKISKVARQKRRTLTSAPPWVSCAFHYPLRVPTSDVLVIGDPNCTPTLTTPRSWLSVVLFLLTILSSLTRSTSSVYVCVCVFMKLHMTAQSSPVM